MVIKPESENTNKLRIVRLLLAQHPQNRGRNAQAAEIWLLLDVVNLAFSMLESSLFAFRRIPLLVDKTLRYSSTIDKRRGLKKSRNLNINRTI
jgi:hypothetical protein